MAAPNNEQLLKELQAELADIERQQQDKTLSHSDQQMLDQAWEDVTNRIDALEQSLEAYQEYIERQRTEWYDAAEYLEAEDSDSDEVDGYGERAAAAPATPSVTVQARFRVDSKTGTVTIEAVLPRPPSITIPPLTSLAAGAPPAPRADQSVSICNCDADGMCGWCQDQMAEAQEQSDCRSCSGCHYCQTNDGYDPNGEI